MKTTTIHLTDEQARRLDEETRRSGLPIDVLIRDALDAFLGIASNGRLNSVEVSSTEDEPAQATESPFRRLIGIADSGREKWADLRRRQSEVQESITQEDRPDLWFIGIGRRDRSDISANVEQLLEDEYLLSIWEDSFGGTRAEEDLLEWLRSRRRAAEDEPNSPGSVP